MSAFDVGHFFPPEYRALLFPTGVSVISICHWFVWVYLRSFIFFMESEIGV